MLTDRELERYRRQIALFGEEAQERLANARVVIVGAGGLGCPVALYLAAAGHWKEAFDACEYILERIKQSVPIWKKEIGKDGERWVPEESFGGDA